MKKILSLLVLLVTTLSAFALDFTDYRKVKLGSYTPTESNDAKLSVTDNGDGTYNVTFNDIINKNGSYTDNYGTFTFSNVSGSTSGDVTTVTATDVTGTVSGGSYNITEFTKGNLSLKFKDGKAYATMTATCRVFYSNYTFDVVFCTDEGFGGGSTGGGEVAAPFEKVNFVGDGTKFKWNIPVDWATQKIVMSISTATCTTGCEHIIGLGADATSWNNNLHMYRTSNDQLLQCYFDAGAGNNNTGKFPEGNPIKVEISKDNGLIVDGETRIAASKLSDLFARSTVVMGTGEGVNIPSHATYNYVKVVPRDWTEVPPVTVAETFTYDQDAFVGPNDTKGTANVKVYKMTDGTYTMEITAPVATKVGVITVGEDTKGRTTYMGEVESSVVDGVKYVVNGVVYEEGGAKHLYMTLTHDDDTYIIGENPDAPKVVSTLPFENVAYTTSYNGQGTANVTFTEMSDGTFPMTFVSDGLNVNAENLTKGEDAKGRTTYTGTAKRKDVDVTFTVKAVVYGEAAAQKLYMTMDNGAGFVVTVGEDPDYVAPVVYKNTLKVVRGTDTKAYENAEVSVLAKGENKYAVTIPSFTDMDQMEGTIGKLTFEATGVEENGTLKLTATSAATTQEGGTGWENAGFTASMDATVTDGTLAGTFTVVYPNDATNYTYTLYYGVEPPTTPEAPKDVTVVEKYQADGSGFSHTINVDWDKQKIVASIDFSNGGDDKDILAMTTGDSFAAFQTSTYRTMHWYCNQTAKQMSGFFAKDGAGNNNTGRMDVADCLAKFEISKAEGLKVNGEVKMTPAVLEELLTGAPIIIGSGESPKFSNAFYNYIKVVSLDWKETTEPTEPEVKVEKTFTDAMSQVVGDVSEPVGQAKVTIKEMSDETINMTVTIVGQAGAEYTASGFTKAVDAEKNRTTYTGKINIDDDFDVTALVYADGTVEKLYMVAKGAEFNYVIGTNPDAAKVVSDKTYRSSLKLTDAESEEDVVDMPEADVNIIKYSDESYKITLKQVAFRGAENDLVFVGKTYEEVPTAEAAEPLYISATPNTATKAILGDVTATFAISEVSENEIKMGIAIEGEGILYEGDFNYDDAETPDVYTSNLHIYDATAPETDLFQADQATVELLFKADNTYTLAIKNVTLNEKTQDLVFTGASAMTDITGTADEATATFLGVTSATIKYNISYDKNDNLVMTFAITAGDKNYAGEFNYEKKDPVEEYPINFDKDANSTHKSRALNSFSLQQTGKEKQTKSVKTSKAAYEDHTADEPFTVEAGSELTASFDYTGEWMHSFVYIDFDNDGQFSYKEGQWDQTGTDLVAFSFYSLDSNPKNDASGYNSVGDELTGDARNTYAAPSFKAPAKAGEYRIRFKFDWNCILPGGSSSILSDGGGVWDATLKVVEPVVDGISSINAEVANGETQLFTVNGVKLNKLQKGLNIVRTADGKVKKVLVK